MAWSWVNVLSIANLRACLSLAVCDGKLWVVTDEDYGVTKGGKVYYTTDGTSWTHDTAWTGVYHPWEFCVHNGDLYLLCTSLCEWGLNYYLNTAKIYRRDESAWTLVQSGDSEDIYGAFASDGTKFIIVGTHRECVIGATHEYISRIWSWVPGGARVEEFVDDFVPVEPHCGQLCGRVPRAVGYCNGTWYAETRCTYAIGPVYTRTIRRYVDATWWEIGDTKGERPDIIATGYGILAGQYLYSPWTDTRPGENAIRSLINYIGPIGSEDGETGRVYTYHGGTTWTDRGQIDVGVNVNSFQNFGDYLYAAGDMNFNPGHVWRTDDVLQHEVLIGAWPKPTARQLVCDHQYGDTIYLGCYKNTGDPFAIKLASDFAESEVIFDPSSGSYIQTQTIELRDTAFVFGDFGTDDNIQYTETGGDAWADGDDDWGNERVATMEYHPYIDDDLVITRQANQDWMQTLTQRPPWTDKGATPFVARAQLRVRDDIWIGSETGGSSVVRLLSGGSTTWVDRSSGLPNLPINDLELGY